MRFHLELSRSWHHGAVRTPWVCPGRSTPHRPTPHSRCAHLDCTHGDHTTHGKLYRYCHGFDRSTSLGYTVIPCSLKLSSLLVPGPVWFVFPDRCPRPLVLLSCRMDCRCHADCRTWEAPLKTDMENQSEIAVVVELALCSSFLVGELTDALGDKPTQRMPAHSLCRIIVMNEGCTSSAGRHRAPFPRSCPHFQVPPASLLVRPGLACMAKKKTPER
jgi:hypothetical protein